MVYEHRPQSDAPGIVGTQKDDAFAGPGLRMRLLLDPVHHELLGPIDRPLGSIGFGDENVAVGQDIE